MSTKDRYDQQLKSVVKALARSVAEASDDEIVSDAKASGFNLEANAAELKAMFLGTAKTFQKRKLIEAKEVYAKQVQRLQQTSFQLPRSPAEREALLQLVIAQQSQRGNALTAKFRDFENISPEDVESLLQELGALGLLPAEFQKPNE